MPGNGTPHDDVSDRLRGRRQRECAHVTANASRVRWAGFETYASGEELPPPSIRSVRDASCWTCACAGGAVSNVQTSSAPPEAMLPVIVLTGHGNVPTSVRALKAGAVDFLQKPAPPKILLERIRRDRCRSRLCSQSLLCVGGDDNRSL